MRPLINNQPETGGTIPFGVTPIREIKFDPKCRDETTKLLRGIQEIYLDEKSRKATFEILKTMPPEETSLNKGRSGMALWTIFILGMLRLGCNWDYDKLKNSFDNHKKIRQMTGLDIIFDQDEITSLQSIHDNVALFTEDVADQINQVVINFGHRKLFPKAEELHTRCDSFVVLSNVHYPTDLNLLKDCVRKSISLCTISAEKLGLPGWRQHESMQNKFRAIYNRMSKMRYSNSEKDEVKEKRKLEIHAEIRRYLNEASKAFIKAIEYQELIGGEVTDLDNFLSYGSLLMDQITRRIFNNETIPPDEKIYSVFEPYTEWICKGKAGVRQELGVKVCVVEDQFGFILNHRVMQNEQDKDVAFGMAQKCQELFPKLASMSFDKGFHSALDDNGKNNSINIKEQLEVTPYLPAKGRLNKKRRETESTPEFGAARKQHPAVESAINALASHGLDRCPDKGDVNYKRYIAMAVSASNIHRIGALLMARELEQERKKRRKLRKKRRQAIKKSA
ncbi:MAG: ISNCY family transposase [Lentisphaeraceae bacterium]|nr:ISNCY family transposase [Lentisphaeraceae bacterium]